MALHQPSTTQTPHPADNTLEEDDHFKRVELVLQLVFANGCLSWNDGNQLAMASKVCHQFWSPHKEKHPDVQLFLNILDQSNSTNLCLRCQLPYCPASLAECTCEMLAEHEERFFQAHDPRANADYDNLSTYDKCMRMSIYYKWLVRNLQSLYDFEHLTELLAPSQIQLAVFLTDSHQFEVPAAIDEMRRRTPRRFAFALNLVSLAVAQEQLCTKGEYPLAAYFALAFAGNLQDQARFLDATVAEQLLENLEVLAPAADHDLEYCLRTYCYVHDWLTEEEAARIGWLAMRFSMFRPFFPICPPDGRGIVLPFDLEPLEEDHQTKQCGT